MKALYVLTKQMSNQLEPHTDAISRMIRKECDDRDLSPVAQRSTQICNESECKVRNSLHGTRLTVTFTHFGQKGIHGTKLIVTFTHFGRKGHEKHEISGGH